MDKNNPEENRIEKARLKQQEERDDLGRESSGLHGGRIDKNYGESGDTDPGPNNKSTDDDNEFFQFMDMVITTQERMHRQFLNSINEARKFSEYAGKEINRHTEKLDKLKSDLKENTITLSDGLSVYKDGDKFYYQDADNQWLLLENESLIAAATEKEQALKAQGKIPATRQDKEQIDLYEAAILGAGKTREELNSMNDQFEEDVKSGKFSEDELKEKQENRDQKQEELEQILKDVENKYDQAAHLTPEEETTELYGDMDQSIFSTPALEEPQRSGISDADPVIKSDVPLSGDFKMASEGDINTPEQQPAIEPKAPPISPPSLG